MKPSSTAPLPVLGLEADREREARRQRRMLAAGRVSLLISTISLSLMGLALLWFVPMLVSPAVQRFNESHGNLFFATAVVMVLLSLPGGLIGYIVSTFGGATPAGKKGALRGGLTIGVFVIALMVVGLFAAYRGTTP